MTDSDSEIFDTARLAEMWDLAPSTERLWQPDELGAVLCHQLAAPLTPAAPAPAGSGAQPPATAGELLSHPSPPLELLIRLKEFAKSNIERQDSALPTDVAKVLYCSVIAAALLHCDKRITHLSDHDLKSSMNWAAAQPWIESHLRRLLNAGLRKLSKT